MEVCFIDDADDMAIYTKNKDNVAKAIALGVVKTYLLKKKSTSNTTKKSTTKKTVAAAKSFSKSLTGKYKITTASTSLRLSPSKEDNIIVSIKKSETVNCYGYYTHADGVNWFLVEYKGNVGYCSAKHLTKK